MKDEDIKLPEVPKQFTKIWSAISSWQHAPDDSSECIQFANEIDAAIIALIKEQCFAAVRLNQLSAVGERKPFDLEAAKDGAKLVTRDGREARFVAHVPDADEFSKVLAIIDGSIQHYHNDGRYSSFLANHMDLFLAPNEPVAPRVMWMTVSPAGYYSLYETELIAAAAEFPRVPAVKVEIREVE